MNPHDEPATRHADTRISFPAQLRRLALAAPDRPAVTEYVAGQHRTVTRLELDTDADALADTLGDLGVGIGDFVTIGLPNGIAFVRALVACWKLGATPQPVSSRLPVAELSAIIDLASPAAVIGVTADVGDVPTIPADWTPPRPGEGIEIPGERVDRVSPSWKAPTSGGSTGRPKLIVSGEPALTDPTAHPILLIRRDGTLVMPGPLYHNGPLSWSCISLLAGGHVVLFDRFDPAATLAAIEAHHADMVYLVPTMMKRISRLDSEVRCGFDLSSLKVVWHLAEPCPEWLKQEWIDWLGPTRIYELYGGTENQAVTVIRGDEWLAHRGSVGRPVTGEMAVLRDDGTSAEPGEIGEIFMRRGESAEPTYRYIGAEAQRRAGGWESLGDMGSMDSDGYLYLSDRRADMVLRGGANIYPAEVEAVVAAHPAVESVAVIGVPDDDLGNRLHAIVHTQNATPTLGDELASFARERLVAYKVPESWEFTTEPLRDDAGKVRRSALRDDRLG